MVPGSGRLEKKMGRRGHQTGRSKRGKKRGSILHKHQKRRRLGQSRVGPKMGGTYQRDLVGSRSASPTGQCCQEGIFHKRDRARHGDLQKGNWENGRSGMKSLVGRAGRSILEGWLS